jgi:glycosylphosphatidylinositol transamidase (GPIT) subunit GPI8
LLLSGTKDFWNYRHQAGTCRAFHLFKDLGVNDIVQFNFDDVASSSDNPVRGKLYADIDGKEVHAGCEIQYSQKNVNAHNFTQALIRKGKSEGKPSKAIVYLNGIGA